MIAYLKGEIIKKQETYLIVETGGIGYKVFVTTEIVSQAEEGEIIELYIHQQVKEDVLDLYGFVKWSQLELFKLLISISGVGPKTALGVFAAADINDIRSAILNEDATILKSVSGIGAKTAERIVLELKNKISGLVGVDGIKSKDQMTADTDAVEALTALGFSVSQAREALKKVDNKLNASDKVKEALKLLR